jgi:hypothetical protein
MGTFIGPGRVLEQLEARRAELRMPMRVLAHRSNLDIRKLYRALRDRNASTSIATVDAIARALWLELGTKNILSAEAAILWQAKLKARKLVAMTQGTSALEGQAVGAADMKRLERVLTARLVGGRPSELWG